MTAGAGIAAALAVGAFSADVVALKARKHAQADGRSPTVAAAGPARALAPQILRSAWPTVQRRLANLPEDQRPVPGLAAYDALLRHTP